MNHTKYRADIDGLRAIAILLVIGYHASPSILEGGYIGVDIFFVISGFLISTIIFDNLDKNVFSYSEFYSRRVKRIFPALILVLTFNLLFGWFVLFPDEFSQLGKHIAGGIGFISNFVLWSEHGYFDNASETKPLLHLWSLGIEEQFYILWPLLLSLLWKNKINLLYVTILIAIISFSANVFALKTFSSSSAFYLPSNRFWELMIGGILAYIRLHTNTSNKNKRYINYQSIIGCLLIIMSLVYLDKDSSYPGWWGLFPTLGAFFILSSPGSWINNHILSNRLFVYIGLISYPLYLWHWSLLSFLHILDFNGWTATLSIVLLSFVLASATYEFIEKNTRYKKKTNVVYILSLLSLALLCIGLSISAGMFKPRNNSLSITLATDAVGDWEYPNGLKASTIDNVKVFIKTGSKEKVLFFGDSHIQQYAPRIVEIINRDPENTKTAIFATKAGCPPIPDVYDNKHPLCKGYYKKTIINYALSNDVDSVVIGANWEYLSDDWKSEKNEFRYHYLLDGEKIYLNKNTIHYALKSLERFITDIAKQKKVYLLVDNPTGTSFNPKTFISGSRIKGVIDNTMYFQAYDKKQAEIRKILIEMAQRSQATIIDPVKHFCTDDQCRIALDNGKPIYKDSNHIRASYMKKFGGFIDLTVQK